MNTKFLKLSCITLILLTFFGCPKDSSQEITENLTWEFCDTDCAVDCSLPNAYNTDKGSAYFTIPIPKNSKLSKPKIKDNGLTVYFTCENSKFEGDLINIPIKISSGLSKDEKSKLLVSVDFLDYECDVNPKATRNKGSVLQGNPIVDTECYCPKE